MAHDNRNPSGSRPDDKRGKHCAQAWSFHQKDRRITNLRSVVQNNFGGSRRAFRDSLQRPISLSYIHRILTGERNGPDWFWDAVTFDAPYGGTSFVEAGDNEVLQVLSAIAQAKKYQALAVIADALMVGPLVGQPKGMRAKVCALRANAHGAAEEFDLALERSEHSLALAKAEVPELAIRYELNTIGWRRETQRVAHKAGQLSDEGWQHALRELLDRLVAIEAPSPEDEELRLRQLMRTASLLDDEDCFERFLTMALAHRRFGNSQREREVHLRDWMSAKKDEDGDFKNARGYACFEDLFQGV